MIKLVGKLSDFLDQVASVITVVLVAFLSILIFVSVFFRYVLNSPVTWQYEVTLVCLSWVIFIGMSMTFKTKEHMALTFVTGRLKSTAKVIWLNVLDLIAVVFLVLGIYYSIEITKNTWDQIYMTVELSRGFFYLSFPIGCFISVIHLVDHVLNRDKTNVETALTEPDTNMITSSQKEG